MEWKIRVFLPAVYMAFIDFCKLCKLYPGCDNWLSDCPGQIQEQNGLQIGNNYRNNKACWQFIDAIAEDAREEVAYEISAAKFVTVFGEGTMDRGVIEQEGVYLRYVNSNNTPKTTMVDCVALEKGDEDGILKGIDKGLKTVGVQCK